MKGKQTVDLGEYKVEIEYNGNGQLIVTILDEIGDVIEGIEISDDKR